MTHTVILTGVSSGLGLALGTQLLDQGHHVVGVSRRSPANRVGLRPGDVVLKINDAEIGTVADVVNATAETRRRWSLVVERGGRILRVSVRG